MRLLKKHGVLVLTALAYGVLFVVDAAKAQTALQQTWRFVLEMLQVLPPVMILSSLIAVWVPRERIQAAMGSNAGWKGVVLSFLVGSLSAGPIYAAFPAALVLHKKGASLKNLVIIISSWAVIKVPLILVESSFLGVPFAALRYGLTLPAILLMGVIMEKLVPTDAVTPTDAGTAPDVDQIAEQLPGRNCGACGYRSCTALAQAIAGGERAVNDCVFVDE